MKLQQILLLAAAASHFVGDAAARSLKSSPRSPASGEEDPDAESMDSEDRMPLKNVLGKLKIKGKAPAGEPSLLADDELVKTHALNIKYDTNVSPYYQNYIKEHFNEINESETGEILNIENLGQKFIEFMNEHFPNGYPRMTVVNFILAAYSEEQIQVMINGAKVKTSTQYLVKLLTQEIRRGPSELG
ncbi:hypothetical protein PsorP6_010494 [Peronosclerospora sorghi]|uniref:Uncharacterized protein n=1 Tax=Peronosclerospora sorghi TaxID=230839 RepID=A0ACC0VV56_9STRA|nr:hypothetical protein PsorP6_010494 [Peronosclerospora sorghi]